MSKDLLIFARFVQFAAAMLLFGASLFALYTPGNSPPVEAFLRRWTLPLSLGALISAIAWLMLEGALMSSTRYGWADPTILLIVLHSTQFGHIWQWRLTILAVLTVFAFLSDAPIGRGYARGVAILSGLAVATMAGVGHGAMGVGWDAWLHLGNQAAHMLAASIWVGGLAALLSLVSGTSDRDHLIHALRRFSGVGFAAVLVILASGLLNAWFLVGSFHALVSTTYGHLLMIKVSFFLAMIGLALFNRLVLMPRLADDHRAERSLRLLVRLVAAEQIIAIMVIACVSVLGTLAPAFDMPGMTM